MILCNGAPKTGTHLIWKVVGGFSGCFFNSHHGHIEYGEDTSKYTHHIQMTRNKRNQYVSYVRMMGLQGKGIDSAKAAMTKLAKQNKAHEGWLTDPNVLVIDYDDLTGKKEETLQRISDYIGVPVPENITDMFKDSATYTGSPSNWETSPIWPKPIEVVYHEFMEHWESLNVEEG